MTDLDRLIEAVEAGTARAADFVTAFPQIGLSSPYYDARAAYHGSLDAAKRLHDALLPGWACALNTNGMAQTIGSGPDWARHTGCVTGNPARAWLLAILRAVKAKAQL